MLAFPIIHKLISLGMRRFCQHVIAAWLLCGSGHGVAGQDQTYVFDIQQTLPGCPFYLSHTPPEQGQETDERWLLSIMATSSGPNSFSTYQASVISENATTSHGYHWMKLAEIAAEAAVLTNDTGTDILLRERTETVTGVDYQGLWDASSGVYPVPENGSFSSYIRGFYWQVSTAGTAHGQTFEAGDRLVFKSGRTHTNIPIDAANVATDLAWERVSHNAEDQLFYKGTYDPAHGEPDLAGFQEGDYLEVINAVNYNGVGWMIGDKLVATDAHGNWERRTYSAWQTLVDGTEMTLPCPGNLGVWELRRADGRNQVVRLPMTVHRTQSTVITAPLPGGQYTLNHFEQHRGFRLNEQPAQEPPGGWAAELSPDQRTITFEPITQTAFQIELRDPRSRSLSFAVSPNQVTCWGDSIANHIYGGIASEITTWDEGNGHAPRRLINHGYGSMDSRQITESMQWASESGGEDLAGINIIAFDFGEKAERQLGELAQQLATLKEEASQFLVFGHYYKRVLLWNGQSFDLQHEPYKESTNAMRESLDEAFGASYIDYEALWQTCLAQLQGLYDPQFPDAEDQAAVIAEGGLPFSHLKNLSGQHFALENPNLFKGHFKGYVDSSPTAPGASLHDYYLVKTPHDLMDIGDLYYWSGNQQWEAIQFDSLHPGHLAQQMIGKHIVQIFQARNW